MRYLPILLALLPLAALASPSTYLIEAKIHRNGKLLSSPALKVLPGEKARIEDTTENGKTGSALSVIATPGSKKGQILVKAVMKSLKNGRWKTIARPQMVVLEKEPASMKFQDGTGSAELSLVVSTATN